MAELLTIQQIFHPFWGNGFLTPTRPDYPMCIKFNIVIEAIKCIETTISFYSKKLRRPHQNGAHSVQIAQFGPERLQLSELSGQKYTTTIDPSKSLNVCFRFPICCVLKDRNKKNDLKSAGSKIEATFWTRHAMKVNSKNCFNLENVKNTKLIRISSASGALH